LILTGNIHHTGDALTAWAVGNVAVSSDKMGNVKPERPKFGSPEKIDPVMALLDALARAAVSGGNANSGASTWFEPFSV
jgi:phage terminase large subunit-like protein